MKIFISSTYEDLAIHRTMLETSLGISRLPYNAMEHFGSTPRPTLRTCLDEVAASDVFLGIIGVRYGGTPPGCAKSYTEREYRLGLRPLERVLITELLAGGLAVELPVDLDASAIGPSVPSLGLAFQHFQGWDPTAPQATAGE